MYSGIVGYARKSSLPSLVAGVGLGLIYGIAANRIQKNKDYGHETALTASIIMASSMVPKAIKTHKPFPVALAICSVATGVYYTNKIFEYWW